MKICDSKILRRDKIFQSTYILVFNLLQSNDKSTACDMAFVGVTNKRKGLVNKFFNIVISSAGKDPKNTFASAILREKVIKVIRIYSGNCNCGHFLDELL